MDGQLAKVTKSFGSLFLWIGMNSYYVCQMGDKLGTYQAQPVPINPWSLVCKWSGREAYT